MKNLMEFMKFIKGRSWLWPVTLLCIFGALTIFSNSILFGSGMIYGEDIRFHLARIQGLTDNIKSGVWYPYINMHFMNGFGYAVDTFYSNTFLYIASLFQVFVKDNLLLAYRFLILVLTFMTLVLTYLSVMAMTQKRDISFFASVIYTLSSYHFIDTYNRGALGETIAFAFVPVVLASFYLMVYKQKNVWYWFVVGMCALVMAHVVTTMMMATVLFGLLLVSFPAWKNNLKMLLWLVLSTVLVGGLTLYITLPLVEQMQAQPLVAQYAPVFKVSNTGLDIGNSFIHAINNDDARSGEVNAKVNIGLLLLLIPFLRMLLFEKKWLQGDYFTIIGFVLLFVSSKIFPWNLFDETPLNAVQFPWRYLVFVTLFLAIGSSMYLHEMIVRYNKRAFISALFIGTVLLLNMNLIYQASFENRKPSGEAFLKDSKFLGAGREYLPTGVNIDDIQPDSGPLHVNESIKYDNFKKDGNHISFTYANSDRGEIAMPIIYYKGYVAQIAENGKAYQIPVVAGSTNLATLELPKGTGTVTFQYKETSIQKWSKLISGVFLFIMLGLLFFYHKKKKVELS